MSSPPIGFSREIEQAAFAWVRRQHDGLTDDEALELHAWIEEDPRHDAAFDHFQRHWARFDPLAGAVKMDSVRCSAPADATGADAEAEPGRRRSGRLLAPLGLAAAAALGFLLWSSSAPPAAGPGAQAAPPAVAARATPALVLPATIARQVLADGTVVELNRGARLAIDFTPAERRVRLLAGEANFAVAKDPAHPFVVEAGEVEVRAVGTAFNVRFDPESVEVVVTEGRVRVATRKETVPLLEAGQAATVSLARASVPAVEALTAEQIDRKLLWQPRLLSFDNQPLSAIAGEFNRRNPVRLVIDPKSGARRMSASFRSDNVEGFVRLLEQHFGITAECREGNLVVLTGR